LGLVGLIINVLDVVIGFAGLGVDGIVEIPDVYLVHGGIADGDQDFFT